jgi:hypothetical protein
MKKLLVLCVLAWAGLVACGGSTPEPAGEPAPPPGAGEVPPPGF